MDLEAQILAAPGDVTLRLVLADALVEAGDPRGELIHLQHALASATGDPRRALRGSIQKILDGLDLVDPRLELEWRLGFVHAATITGDSLALVPRLLEHPAARLLDRLSVAVGERERAPLAQLIAARPRPSLLRRLEVGGVADSRSWVERTTRKWIDMVAKALRGDVAVEPYDRISHAEFAATIGADDTEYTNELHMEQIAPVIEMWPYHAELVIRAGSHDAVTELHDDLSDWVQSLLRLDAERVVFYQASDRTRAGYGNIYQALRALAPHVEDVRFVVGEWGDNWSDEYTIEDGVLVVERRDRENQDDFWSQRVEQQPDDRELRAYATRERLHDANNLLEKLDRETGTKRADTATRTHALLEQAGRLDDTHPDLWRHRGRLARAIGELAASDRAFARWAELANVPGVAFDRALVAITANDDAAASRYLDQLLVEEPAHGAGRLLAAYLAGDSAEPHLRALFATIDERRRPITNLVEAQRITVWTGLEPAQEDLVRTGRHVAILTWSAEAFLRLAARDASVAPAAATYLLGWAEISRIHVAHDRGKREAARLARLLYKTAADIDPLAGSVHYYWSLFDERRATKLLEQGLAIGPDHLGILGTLGAAARKAGNYDRAIELLDRYVTRFRALHTGGVWGLYWDFHLAELSISHYEKACTLLYGVRPGENRPPGKPAKEALDRAESALEPALAMYEKLSWSQQKAGAGVFQCKSLIAEYRGDHQTALEWADRALEANTNNVYLWSTKGGCLNNLGRLDEAVECCEKALALDEKHWHAHLVIACVLAKRNGARDEIYKRLRRVIALWPEGRDELAIEPDLAVLRDEPVFQKLVKRRLKNERS